MYIMKQRGFFLAALFCLLCGFNTLVSCDKSTDSTGMIYTFTINELGVEVPVSGVELVIGEDDHSEDVKRTVITDANGRYEGEWPGRSLYLPVKAYKDISVTQFFQSVAFLPLEPGNVTELRIPLEPVDK